MRKTSWTAAPTHLALLLIAAAYLAGCNTIYHTVLQEMGHDEQQLLADRLSTARNSFQNARSAFDDAFQQASTVPEAEHHDKAHLRLSQAINKAELEAWNARRNLASLRDVAGEASDPTRGHITFIAGDGLNQYQATIEQMQQVYDEMDRALDGLRQQAAILLADSQGASRALQPIPYLLQNDQQALLATIDETLASADAALAMLESDHALVATNPGQAHGHAAAQ